MRRNQIAKLSQNSELGCGWFGVSFFHLRRVTELKSHANHFFCALTKIPMGWLWVSKGSVVKTYPLHGVKNLSKSLFEKSWYSQASWVGFAPNWD
jgi:hypothetical protein